MVNYREHRLESWDWCDEYEGKMGRIAFVKYMDKVYAFLYAMKVKETFSVEKEVAPENRDLFIKIVCMFILEEHPIDIGFSEDYTSIKRYE